MKFLTESSELDSSMEINVTSFIDVLFVLLLFFMVTTSFRDSMGLDINLPKADSAATTSSGEPLTININAQGKFSVAGAAVEAEALTDRLNQERSKNPNAVVIIRADQQTEHGKVVAAMDAALKAGLEKMAIAAAPEIAANVR